MTNAIINKVVENLMEIQPLLYINLLKPARSKSTLPLGALFVISELKKPSNIIYV